MGVIGGRVDLYLDQQHIDTTTPTRRLLYEITGASPSSSGRSFAAGSTWALRVPEHKGMQLGRRPVSTDVVERIREQLATGAGIFKTAKALGAGTVHRVKREMAAAAA